MGPMNLYSVRLKARCEPEIGMIFLTSVEWCLRRRSDRSAGHLRFLRSGQLVSLQAVEPCIGIRVGYVLLLVQCSRVSKPGTRVTVQITALLAANAPEGSQAVAVHAYRLLAGVRRCSQPRFGVTLLTVNRNRFAPALGPFCHVICSLFVL